MELTEARFKGAAYCVGYYKPPQRVFFKPPVRNQILSAQDCNSCLKYVSEYLMAACPRSMAAYAGTTGCWIGYYNMEDDSCPATP